MVKAKYVPSVIVPDEHALLLGSVVKLTGKVIDDINSVFADIGNIFLDKVENKLEHVMPEDFEYSSSQVANVLYSASMTVRKSGYEEETVIEDIVGKINEVGERNLSQDEVNNIRKLVGLSSPLSKNLAASDVYTAHDKTIQSIRIITDVRPLIDNDSSTIELYRLTLYHNLEIGYRSNDKTKKYSFH